MPMFPVRKLYGELWHFLFSSPVHPAQQPISDAHKLACLLPMRAVIRVLNGVSEDPPFFIKIEDESATEFFVVSRVASKPFSDLVDPITSSNPTI